MLETREMTKGVIPHGSESLAQSFRKFIQYNCSKLEIVQLLVLKWLQSHPPLPAMIEGPLGLLVRAEKKENER